MSVVMKFGGTSVTDAEAIRRVSAIIERQWRASISNPPVIIVSALAGVTDCLMGIARCCESGDTARAAASLTALTDRHLAVANQLTSGTRRGPLLTTVREEFGTVMRLVRTLAARRTVSPRSLDRIIAIGELVSSRLVTVALEEHSVPAVWVDPRTIIITNAEHTRAVPDMRTTNARAQECVDPLIRRGAVAVMGGFIGATVQGVTTTLGRGGSDYSAAIVGACLGLHEIQIWTDVDGMLTADPRVVPAARLVERLSYAEAVELAYFGAKVLHPRTILPAAATNTPIRILNSRRPEMAGTVIAADGGRPRGQLAGIACKRGVTLLEMTSTGLLGAQRYVRRLFEVFDRFGARLGIAAISDVSVSVTMDDTQHLDDIVAHLTRFAHVSVERRMGIICAAGEGLRSDSTALHRAMTALADIPLRLVCQAAGRRHMTFVLDEADMFGALARLHDQFFGVGDGRGERHEDPLLSHPLPGPVQLDRARVNGAGETQSFADSLQSHEF